MARIDGTNNDDTLADTAGDDMIFALSGNDTISLSSGVDSVDGGAGNDTLRIADIAAGADQVDLGTGDDVVEVSANAGSGGAANVRLTFTSAEVGNGNALDSNTMTNQDGGLAVRLQREGADGTLTGPISRFDDEGITFVSSATSPSQVTFDVRDLVSGVQRGDQFQVVTLGTAADDVLTARFEGLPTYINAGAGDDNVRGSTGDDFLVGGAGNDFLAGGAGRDGFLGGAGNDTINAVDAADSIFAGVIAPEADTVDAGAGDDQVTGGRLDTLIGGAGSDFLSLNFDFDGPNLDPAAVTLTLDATGSGTANDGTSISGFEFVDLNLTDNVDVVNTGDVRATLVGNGGDDTLTTGAGDDQVFGGSGNDLISTGAGNDRIGGGSGNDVIDGGAGNDSLSVDPSVDGLDRVNLGAGNDTVSFEGFDAGQIRLTFTSAEVGNGNALDGGTLANQDDGLAVRLQREDANGNLIGEVSRYDDEGITFVEGTQGYTFDVRDLPTGIERGNTFTGVVLGTSGNDDLSFFPPFRADQPFYYNAGGGNDVITAGNGADFLVGGIGNDTINAGRGNDTALGGAGNDTILGDDGNDTVFGDAGDDTVRGGAGNDKLNGGAGNDVVSGDEGNDTLDGGEGNDTLGGKTGDDFVFGGAGDDRLFGDAGNDLVDGGAGADQIFGQDGNDRLSGDAGNDIVNGGEGNDIVIGGAGFDKMSGGAGSDVFVFDAALDLAGSRPLNRDVIRDFESGVDTIWLDDAVFAGLPSGTLAASAFVVGTAATTASQRIVYDNQSGALFYDADGAGGTAQVQFAQLTSKPSVFADDFLLV